MLDCKPCKVYRVRLVYLIASYAAEVNHEPSSSNRQVLHTDSSPHLFALLAFLLAASPLHADDVRPADLGELIDKADKLVVLETPRQAARFSLNRPSGANLTL